VPRPGDKVELTDYGLTLTVEVADGRRVGKIRTVRHSFDENGLKEHTAKR
jgi:hypothetical protein